jgi:hypothetical protein
LKLERKMPIIIVFIGLSSCALIALLGGWYFFGWAISLRYLYLSTGLIIAAVYPWMILRSQAGDKNETFFNKLRRRMGRNIIQNSSYLKAVTALALIRETALRIPYWPLEFAIAGTGLAMESAPNVEMRNALGYTLKPRMPLVTSATMLLINLAFLILFYITNWGGIKGAFDSIIFMAMIVTIIWLFAFVFVPIEMELRVLGSRKGAIVNFIKVSCYTFLSVCILSFIYRRISGTDISFFEVASGTLTAGHLYAEQGPLSKIWTAVTNRDFAALHAMPRDYVLTLLAAILFDIAIIKRVTGFIFNRGQAFTRTTEESEAALQVSILLQSFDEAERYAVELPPNHPQQTALELNTHLRNNAFPKALELVEKFVNRLQFAAGDDSHITLDYREKWLVAATRITAEHGDDRALQYLVWSIQQPELETRDLVKLVAMQVVHGGVSQVIAFSHYGYTLCDSEVRGPVRDKLWFQERLESIARLGIGDWSERRGDSNDSSSFEGSYLDFIVETIRFEKAMMILSGSRLFKNAPREMDEKTFGRFLQPPSFQNWTNVGWLSEAESADRFYILDTIFLLRGLKLAPDLDSGLNEAFKKLDHAWGGHVLRRFGVSDRELQVLETTDLA